MSIHDYRDTQADTRQGERGGGGWNEEGLQTAPRHEAAASARTTIGETDTRTTRNKIMPDNNNVVERSGAEDRPRRHTLTSVVVVRGGRSPVECDPHPSSSLVADRCCDRSSLSIIVKPTLFRLCPAAAAPPRAAYPSSPVRTGTNRQVIVVVVVVPDPHRSQNCRRRTARGLYRTVGKPQCCADAALHFDRTQPDALLHFCKRGSNIKHVDVWSTSQVVKRNRRVHKPESGRCSEGILLSATHSRS